MAYQWTQSELEWRLGLGPTPRIVPGSPAGQSQPAYAGVMGHQRHSAISVPRRFARGKVSQDCRAPEGRDREGQGRSAII